MTPHSYIVVACVSDKRWFDLDAVRHENPRVTEDPGGYRMVAGRPSHDAGPREQNPAGAPPLDWCEDDPNEPLPAYAEGNESVTARLLVGDVRSRIRDIPDGSIDLVCTSPPFLALRKYGDNTAEMGSEANPAAFIDALLELTAEFRRVLAPHGSIAIELGDTYSGSGGAGGDYNDDGLRADQPKFSGSMKHARTHDPSIGPPISRVSGTKNHIPTTGNGWPLSKSLAGVPHAYMLSLAYGWNILRRNADDSPAGRWRIRNMIVWARPNPPVGALGDKVRPATSYITVGCVSDKRWFDLDAVRTAYQESTLKQHGPEVEARRGRGSHQGEKSTLTRGMESGALTHAGAPPLDWCEDNDPTGHNTLIMPTAPYPGAHYACVDDQTEALTPYGWRRHSELRDGDLIAAYDRDTERWRFETAMFHRYDYGGDLVAIDKRVTNQRLTPNHRVLYRTRKDRTPKVREASTLSTICQLPVAAEMESGGVGPGEKAAALVGWFVTEGGIVNGWPVIYQSDSANPVKVQAIRSLLDGIGADYREKIRPQRTGVTGKPHIVTVFTVKGALAEWLRQFHKNLPPSAVFGWSEIDARALFDAMVDGDGHRRPDGRMSFIQKSRAVAESFQMLALRLGYRTTMTSRGVSMWTVFVSSSRWVDLRAGRNGLEPAVSSEHYEGVVWCPSVPSTFWLARRNGQPFITGNTWPPTLAKRLIEMMCPLRVCLTCGEPSRRIVRATEEYATNFRTGEGPMYRSETVEPKARGSAPPLNGHKSAQSAQYETLGWTDCGHDTWRQGHVLDPFSGSATTLSVAHGCGRQATGIELYESNAQLAVERMGMFLIVEGGPDAAA